MADLNTAQRDWLEALGALIGAAVSAPPPKTSDDPDPIGSAMALTGVKLAGPSGGSKGTGTPIAAPPPPATNAELPKKAKVTSLGMTRAQYDFGRPITREQAAQVLFVDGKVPGEAELVPGPGDNSWTLKAPDADAWQATLRKMKARTQTVRQGKPNTDGGTWNPPEPDEVTEEWSDGPSKPSTGPARRDLKNDLGFKITRNYRLDEGKSPVKHVKSPLGLGRGHGYELEFAQPVTQAQVMDTLFGKNSLGEGTVYLKTAGKEPATTWQVHVIGVDALGAFKLPAFRAIADANVYAAESIAPDLPKGIRSHIESKTVPKDATRHPPDVYAWEQEGHLVRVETDGKGGYYTYETTALSPSDEASNITIRYFMVEQGMKAREAWQEYVKHWEWIHQQILTALAMALSSGRLPGKAPALPTRTRIRQPSIREPAMSGPRPEPTPPVKAPRAADPEIGVAPTQPAPPQRPVRGRPLDSTHPDVRRQPTVDDSSAPSGSPASQGSSSSGGGSPPRKLNDLTPKNLPEGQQITINTSKGPRQMTVGDYRGKVREANKWVSDQRQKNVGQGVTNHDHKAMYDEAAEKFGLNKNWQYVGNPYVH
ncbi:MAG: hypothetical protein ABI520_14250 [Caldimonas sp.]